MLPPHGWAAAWELLLLLLLLLACCCQPAGSFQICLRALPGFAVCDPTKNDTVYMGADAATYAGFSVDLVRWIGPQIGWMEDRSAANSSFASRRFAFKCTQFDAGGLVSYMTSNATRQASRLDCPVGVGAFTITEARMDAGAQFSYPYLHTGLGVLVAEQQEGDDPWAFLKPLHWTVWLTLALTVAVAPVVTWVVERFVVHGWIPLTLTSLLEMRDDIYLSYMSIFNLDCQSATSLPAQINIIVFQFVILIVVSTYTANLAAVLTVSNINSSISSVGDLRGKAVAAHGIYVDRLKENYGLNPSQLDFRDESTFSTIKQQLLDGTLTAYIYDKSILQYYVSRDNADCSLRFLPGQVNPFDLGVLFHPLVPKEVVQEFNRGVLKAQVADMATRLYNTYLAASADGDMCARGGTGNTRPVKFGQVSGLWIVLGAVYGFTLLCGLGFLGQHLRRAFRLQRHLSTQPKMLSPSNTKRSLANLPSLSDAATARPSRASSFIMTPRTHSLRVSHGVRPGSTRRLLPAHLNAADEDLPHPGSSGGGVHIMSHVASRTKSVAGLELMRMPSGPRHSNPQLLMDDDNGAHSERAGNPTQGASQRGSQRQHQTALFHRASTSSSLQRVSRQLAGPSPLRGAPAVEAASHSLQRQHQMSLPRTASSISGAATKPISAVAPDSPLILLRGEHSAPEEEDRPSRTGRTRRCSVDMGVLREMGLSELSPIQDDTQPANQRSSKQEIVRQLKSWRKGFKMAMSHVFVRNDEGPGGAIAALKAQQQLQARLEAAQSYDRSVAAAAAVASLAQQQARLEAAHSYNRSGTASPAPSGGGIPLVHSLTSTPSLGTPGGSFKGPMGSQETAASAALSKHTTARLSGFSHTSTQMEPSATAATSLGPPAVRLTRLGSLKRGNGSGQLEKGGGSSHATPPLPPTTLRKSLSMGSSGRSSFENAQGGALADGIRPGDGRGEGAGAAGVAGAAGRSGAAAGVGTAADGVRGDVHPRGSPSTPSPSDAKTAATSTTPSAPSDPSQAVSRGHGGTGFGSKARRASSSSSSSSSASLGSLPSDGEGLDLNMPMHLPQAVAARHPSMFAAAAAAGGSAGDRLSPLGPGSPRPRPSSAAAVHANSGGLGVSNAGTIAGRSSATAISAAWGRADAGGSSNGQWSTHNALSPQHQQLLQPQLQARSSAPSSPRGDPKHPHMPAGHGFSQHAQGTPSHWMTPSAAATALAHISSPRLLRVSAGGPPAMTPATAAAGSSTPRQPSRMGSLNAAAGVSAVAAAGSRQNSGAFSASTGGAGYAAVPTAHSALNQAVAAHPATGGLAVARVRPPQLARLPSLRKEGSFGAGPSRLSESGSGAMRPKLSVTWAEDGTSPGSGPGTAAVSPTSPSGVRGNAL